MANTALIIFTSLSVFLLFSVMVLSAIASNNADTNSTCHQYSMYSALVTGLATLVLIIGFGIYIYKSKSSTEGSFSKSLVSSSPESLSEWMQDIKPMRPAEIMRPARIMRPFKPSTNPFD